MLEPVGPLPSRVYWLRRAAVIGVVLAVVGLLLWVTLGRSQADATNTGASTPTTISGLTGDLATPTGGSSTSSEQSATSSEQSTSDAVASSTDAATVSTDAPSTDAQSTDPAAAQSAADTAAAQSSAAAQAADAAAAQAAADDAAAKAAAAAAAASAAAAAQHDDQGRLICPDSSVTLTGTVGSPTYNVGEQPVIGVTVTNTGAEACVKDLSGGLQEFLAYDASGNRIWSTNDCSPGTGSDVRFIQPGESLQYNIRWSGTTSQPGCAGDRLAVPAGEYSIEARIGSVVSSRVSLTLQ